MLIPGHPLRWPEGALAPTFQVPYHPLLEEPIHGAERGAAASMLVVVGPSTAWRLTVATSFGIATKLCFAPIIPRSFSRSRAHAWALGTRLRNRLARPYSVRLVPEAVTQKLQARPRLRQLDKLGLLTVNLKAHPVFHGGVDPVAYAPPLIAGENDKVIGIAHQPCPSPLGRSFRFVEAFVHPVQIQGWLTTD